MRVKRSELKRRVGLVRKTAKEHEVPLERKNSGFAASHAQRKKVRYATCLVCEALGCDPAHVIPRSMGGGDDALDVVPLCREHHREYDEGKLSLLEHMEPDHREEMAQAVLRVGIIPALQRMTNERWWPV